MTILSDQEITQIWKGEDEIVSGSLNLLRSTQSSLDLYTDAAGAYSLASTDAFRSACSSLEVRSVKIRVITEVTRENLPWAKDLLKVAELRHLDGIIGSFAIADHSDYAGSTAAEIGAARFDRLIATNVGSFVRLQEHLFDALWNGGTPAEDRILEIEKGTKSGAIELIPNTQESIAKAFELMNRTQKELLVQFASLGTFALAMTLDTARFYNQITERGAAVSILVPGDAKRNAEAHRAVLLLRKVAPRVLLKVSDARMKTMITILVSDRKEFMSWELKDDTIADPYQAGGIATYSDIESLASSYATIFDNLWAISDLTESLRTANIKLEMNDEAMKEFIDIASHELRTPLQPILGLSQLLSESALQAGFDKEKSATTVIPRASVDQARAIDAISRNARRLQRLAENILDVTRIESGKLRLRKTYFDMCGLAESVVAEHNSAVVPTSKKKGSRIRFNTLSQNSSKVSSTQKPEFFVRGDRDRLAQVINNLISNAARFARSGSISVTVRAASHPSSPDQGEGKDWVELSVSDEGPGIEEELLPRLFDKFVSKSSKGPGLGLYISKKIVEAHGGRIWALNNKGRGATFTFSLPLAARVK